MAKFPEERSFVQAALDGVGRSRMAPVDMRYFAARDGKPADYCRARVRECEVYLAVIGFRYGSVVPGEAVSYTELEFDEASAAGLPRLVFFLEDLVGLPGALADPDRAAVEGFRQRIRDAGLIVRHFASAAGLELEVFHALTELADGGQSAAPRTGASWLALRYSLPPDTAAFTGRAGELGLITAALPNTAMSGGVVAIHAIKGMPGVGKTALAVHAAHMLKGLFPDRQLFIDLHAHTPGQDPLSPEAALAGLLTAVGVDPRFLPADLAGRTGLWRDRMAGQRVLLVLDNAASSAQIAPLLPSGDGCLVLVTSRRHLGDLPGAAVPVPLDALPPDDAQAMFVRLAPRAEAAPTAAVAELVGLAGCLPLAVSLLARVHSRHPSWTLADLVAETRASLLTLTAENNSAAAAFEVSYRYLDPARQRLFRRLGLHPGTTADAYAAAALAGIPLPEAAGLLDGLHGEGLLTEVGYRRYGMHDLIRRYARKLADADSAVDCGQALERLLDYYQQTAATAEAVLTRQPRTRPAQADATTLPVVIPSLLDRVRALAWARAERANLLACLDHVTRAGQQARVVALTAGIADLLRQDGPWVAAISLHGTAVQAAGQLSDRLGQADALSNLGTVLRLAGDTRGAAQAQDAALDIYRDVGDQPGQACALNELGAVRLLTRDYQGGAEALEAGLRICRDLNDRLGEGNALRELGIVRYQTGDYHGAAEALEAGLRICRDLNDRLGEAHALNELGAVRRQTGDYYHAAEALEAALGIYLDLGNRLGQANALNYLGAVRQLTEDYQGAAKVLETALRICRDLGFRLGEANADNYLGVARRLTGDHQGAAEALEAALRIYRDLGDQGGEAEVLNQLGTLHRVRGDLDQACRSHRQALDLAHEIDSTWDEAHALAGLGRCALAAGRAADAVADLRRAWEIFHRLGAAEAVGLAAELDSLP